MPCLKRRFSVLSMFFQNKFGKLLDLFLLLRLDFRKTSLQQIFSKIASWKKISIRLATAQLCSKTFLQTKRSSANLALPPKKLLLGKMATNTHLWKWKFHLSATHSLRVRWNSLTLLVVSTNSTSASRSSRSNCQSVKDFKVPIGIRACWDFFISQICGLVAVSMVYHSNCHRWHNGLMT